MSKEERIELLKRAREAKAQKKSELDAKKPVAVKGRPKKKDEARTLDIVEDVLNEDTEEVAEEITEEVVVEKPKPKIRKPKLQSSIDNEPDVIEKEIIEKIKKPKRRILRKIIKQEYDSEDTEEEYEEVVYKPPKRTQNVKPVKLSQPEELPRPKEVEIKKVSNPFFNY